MEHQNLTVFHQRRSLSPEVRAWMDQIMEVSLEEFHRVIAKDYLEDLMNRPGSNQPAVR
jgi:hypothetical protein